MIVAGKEIEEPFADIVDAAHLETPLGPCSDGA